MVWQYFACSNDFYLPSLRLEEGGGVGSAPCGFPWRIPPYPSSPHKHTLQIFDTSQTRKASTVLQLWDALAFIRWSDVSPVNVSSSRRADVQLLTEVAELVEKNIKCLDAGFSSINFLYKDFSMDMCLEASYI